MKSQMHRHKQKSPVCTENMDAPCQIGHPFDPDESENIVGQQNTAHHGADHRQSQQYYDHSLQDSVHRIFSPCNVSHPSSVQNMVPYD